MWQRALSVGGGGSELDSFLTELLTDGNWTFETITGYSANRVITFNAVIGKKYLIVYGAIYTSANAPVNPTGATLITSLSKSFTSPAAGGIRFYDVQATSTTVSHDTNIGSGTMWYQVVEC